MGGWTEYNRISTAQMNVQAHDMHHDDSRGYLTMIIIMAIGQILMVMGNTLQEITSHGILLFDILQLDQYLMVVVHLFSLVSFGITILVGVPKALKVIRSIKIFTRKKARRKNKTQ